MTTRITIQALDSFNRVIAEQAFRKTWRHNEVMDQRETGFRLDESKHSHGCDFGDLNFFVAPPMGDCWGIIAKDQIWNHIVD